MLKDYFKNRLILILLILFISMACIAIFQDYLHAKRNSSSFYFEESLLFKTVWFYFPPLLLSINQLFDRTLPTTTPNLIKVFTLYTSLHALLVAITIWAISSIFREQSYGIYKVLTFTLSNDLLSILMIYSAFLAVIKFFDTKKEETNSCAEKPINTEFSFLTINSGRKNELVKFDDIITIKSATPYICVQTAEKNLLHSATLKSIVGDLDSRFIRVHRSMIVNIEKVLSYHSRLNGDYDLTLENGHEVRLSRNYVKDFKNVFNNTHQVTT